MRNHAHFLFIAACSPQDTVVVLDKNETRHCRTVLRAQPGDTILVTNGSGVVHTCRIDTLDGDTCRASVVSSTTVPQPLPRMHFCVGIPAREAFEETLAGLAGLGAATITPVVCRFCQDKWWDKSRDKHALRFERLVIASVKQSLSGYIPVLLPPCGFEAALGEVRGTCLFADPKGRRMCEVGTAIAGQTDVSCFVGPPGGFAEEELAALKTRGGIGVWLSPTRLRTELATAALAANVVQFQRSDKVTE